MRVQVKVAWAPTDEEALAGAYDQWRTNVFDSVLMADIETVDQFEAAAAHVRPEDVRRSDARVVRHQAARRLAERGPRRRRRRPVPPPGARDQRRFIDTFGAEVLPQVAAG